MLLFRSGGHVTKWLAGRAHGASIPVVKLAELANAWWGNRLAPDWHPLSRSENQAILDELGLTGPFWSLGYVFVPLNTARLYSRYEDRCFRA